MDTLAAELKRRRVKLLRPVNCGRPTAYMRKMSDRREVYDDASAASTISIRAADHRDVRSKDTCAVLDVNVPGSKTMNDNSLRGKSTANRKRRIIRRTEQRPQLPETSDFGVSDTTFGPFAQRPRPAAKLVDPHGTGLMHLAGKARRENT